MGRFFISLELQPLTGLECPPSTWPSSLTLGEVCLLALGEWLILAYRI